MTDPPRATASSRVRRWIEPAVVVVTAAMALLVASLVLGISRPGFIIGPQALAPIVLLPAPFVAVAAVARRRWRRAVVATAVVVAHLALVAPQATADDQPAWASSAPTFRLFSGNARFDNDDPDAVADAIARVDADVIIINEATVGVRERLARRGVLRRYPVEVHTGDAYGYGEMIMTRLPVVDSRVVTADKVNVPEVIVRVGTRRVRILAVHPRALVSASWSTNSWLADQASIRRLAVDERRHDPVVMAGDFNASVFNAPFDDLADAGFYDAHDVLGEGLTQSWGPLALSGTIGALIRIDHCVYSDAVSAREVHNGEIPGSDHVPFEVTLAVDQSLSRG